MKEQVRIIRERMVMTRSKQKRYVDTGRRHLTFEEGDWVYLKVSPMKDVKRFGKKGKLSPRYVRQYQVLEW